MNRLAQKLRERQARDVDKLRTCVTCGVRFLPKRGDWDHARPTCCGTCHERDREAQAKASKARPVP